MHAALATKGAVPRYVGARLGAIDARDGNKLEVEVTFETTPSVLFDAVIIPDGKAGTEALGELGQALEFVKDQYRHCKPILALGAGVDFLEAAGIQAALPSGKPDPGLVIDRQAVARALSMFVNAVAKHRHYERAIDPPAV
jgi:catalase